MAMLNRTYGYSKLLNEDPEDTKSRRAQFLIYKAMQKADTLRSKPSWLRFKMYKLKFKIGKKMKKLKKGFSSTAFSAKADLFKQISILMKSCKYLVNGKQGQIVRTLPSAIC